MGTVDFKIEDEEAIEEYGRRESRIEKRAAKVAEKRQRRSENGLASI